MTLNELIRAVRKDTGIVTAEEYKWLLGELDRAFMETKWVIEDEDERAEMEHLVVLKAAYEYMRAAQQ